MADQPAPAGAAGTGGTGQAENKTGIVCDKPGTAREARSGAWVRMAEQSLMLIETGRHRKGDVITVARIAGIQAARCCADRIPLCHPLMLSGIDVDIALARVALLQGDLPVDRMHQSQTGNLERHSCLERSAAFQTACRGGGLQRVFDFLL